MIEIGPPALPLDDRVEFLRSLGNWLNSGGGHMSLSEAVKFTCDTFSRDEYKMFRQRMEHIMREVQGGQTPLFEALQAAKLGFSRQEIAIVEAGEKSNQLKYAIPDLVEALEVKTKARKSLAMKLAMPLIGGFMLIVMTVGVMTIMMPQVLGPVLQRNPDALDDMPFVIGMFWAASQWLQNYWRIPVAMLIGLTAVFLFRGHPAIKPYVEKVQMSFGPLRRLSLAYNAVLVVYFMPALVRAGIPFHEILRTLAGTLENMGVAASLNVAANDHEGGLSLVESLEAVPFKGSFRSAIESGEKTGKMAERVEDLKAPYMGELERVIRRTVGAITLLVMAILLPMFLLSMYITLTVPIFALMEY